MIATYSPFEETCAQLFNTFFKKYPKRTAVALLAVMKRQKSFPGKHEGWAAGIMFAVCSRGCGVPDVMNSEVEEAFGVTMSTVRKRAWAVKRLLGLLPPGI
jgi:transcription initiation factor TFIIIB Brf1 subunit/transcription initiation factor TFIIB